MACRETTTRKGFLMMDPNYTPKEGDVAHVCLPIGIYSRSTFPAPYDEFHALWKDLMLTVSGTKVTLGVPFDMYTPKAKPPHPGKEPGFMFTPEHKVPEDIAASWVSLWVPSIWLIETSVSSVETKSECTCPWTDVLRYGCRKGHK